MYIFIYILNYLLNKKKFFFYEFNLSFSIEIYVIIIYNLIQ